ncbi:MAG: hypothetical protein KAS17_07385, partial [Victivallaceae bacterium]|nr:hypothetical protein [Victivallaceae bacterium]
MGIPSGTEKGLNGLLNLQYVLALNSAAEMHKQLGSKTLADEYARGAKAVAKAVHEKFWVEKQRLFAHDENKREFCEHMQCLAVLSGAATKGQTRKISKSILNNDIDKTTIYFSHYLLEVLPMLNLMDSFTDKITFWKDLSKQGFKTLPEAPYPCRSDCHAWGAHPMYHYFTKLLGVTPKSPGFKEIRIQPN